MIAELRTALERYSDGVSETVDVCDELKDAVESLLAEPTNVQALALARLMRQREGQSVRIFPGAAGLPNDYLLCDFDGGQEVGGFTCGIAPDGSVAS